MGARFVCVQPGQTEEFGIRASVRGRKPGQIDAQQGAELPANASQMPPSQAVAAGDKDGNEHDWWFPKQRFAGMHDTEVAANHPYPVKYFA